VYPTFLDISGQRAPTLGDHARTVAAAFGGNEAKFDAVNPLDVLARERFPRSHGVFVVGAADTEYKPPAEQVFAAARAAGMQVRYREVPGGHDYQAWRQGLVGNLGWLGTRLGLTA